VWFRGDLPATSDGIVVDIGPLVDLPDDCESWIAATLMADLPPSSTVTRSALAELEHADGWPVSVIVTAVRDEKGDEVERRIVWLFRLHVRGALIVARVAASAIAAFEGGIGRELVDRLLATAISMRGPEIAALAELDA